MSTPLRLLVAALLICGCSTRTVNAPGSLAAGTAKTPGSFTIAENGRAAAIWVDANDFPGVARAAADLQKDIHRVTGLTPALSRAITGAGPNVIIAGSLGQSAMLDNLIRNHKIDVRAVQGKWESYLIRVVADPVPGVGRALVIAGSDKRGAIYGIYDVSQRIGVSPWYFWSDTPVPHKDALYLSGEVTQGPPSVKYRGLFLNDEDPDLSRWVRKQYGTVPGLNDVANYGAGFYTNLFELILRLKGNYLWPAMWNNAFNEDDTNNPVLANEYGVVMGTSHQEPMLRAQKEWDRKYAAQYGSWNYARYPDALENFWREGIRRNKNYESILTIGLRGANDTPMAPGGPEANRTLLEKIVGVQRKMIGEELDTDVTKVPQLWCLYKEVQDFYEAGMRAPDDVTLLWAEDNAGDVRRLPTAAERKRSGGAGIYYHFDYHGGPRDFRWINSTPIEKIWDQMSLAKKYGADRIWIVNAGHLKGYEFVLEYWFDLGWDTTRWNNSNFGEFTRLWCEREFGPAHAGEIAAIMDKANRYNSMRRPELVDASTYSLENYNEAGRVVANFDEIAAKAAAIYDQLPAETRDTYYQTVLFPVKASAQLNEMYLAANENQVYAKQGRASANDKADECRALFVAETNLMFYYNHDFARGKWEHFMDEPVIGYTSWQPPRANTLSATRLASVTVPDTAEMGVDAEGTNAFLPQFDIFNRQRHYVDVFRKGSRTFAFTASASDPWITLSTAGGTVDKDQRVWVSVDWNKAPKGKVSGSVQFSGANTNFTVQVTALYPTEVTPATLQGFVEGEGLVSIEPEHFTKNTPGAAGSWIKIDNYGRTLSGMRAEAPVDGPEATPGKDSPCLEYKMFLFSTGDAQVMTITSPTLNFLPEHGLSFALALDDTPPQTVTLVPAKYVAGNGNRDWENSVKDNARIVRTKLAVDKPGYHTLKIWMVDPGVVVQKLVVDMGGLKPSYLGPPESFVGGR
jgi:hypothetical protein